MPTNLLDHLQVIPFPVDDLQDTVMDGPGAATDGLPLIGLAEGCAAIQGFMQLAASLDLRETRLCLF